MDVKYYECHITIDPVFDERLEKFTEVCALEGFKPAKLLMQKSTTATPEVSKKDTFCTAHAKPTEYYELTLRAARLLTFLRIWDFKVRRYKIEAVVFDQRF